MVNGIECYSYESNISEMWNNRLEKLETSEFNQIVKSCLEDNPTARARLDYLLGLTFFDVFSGKFLSTTLNVAFNEYCKILDFFLK